MKKVFKTLTAIATVLLLTAMVACDLDENSGVVKGTAPATSSGVEATATPATTPESEEVTATIGEFLSNEKWKITLQDAKQFDKINEKNEFLSEDPEDGKVFLVLFFEVENISSKDDYFNYLYFENYADDYSINQKILINDVDGYKSLAGDVAANKKRKGYLAFEVSSDWKKFETSYREFTGNALKFKVSADQIK